MKNIRTTTGILIATPLLFWGGWNIGKAVYPESASQQSSQSQGTTVATRRSNEAPAKQRATLCATTLRLADEADRHYCDKVPKLNDAKGLQIDLTAQKAILFDDGMIVDILPVAYQSPEGVWFQTPTGYFRAGIKHEQHHSSLFPVQMPYAIQLTEDFFMHEIPFYADGTKVTSKFSGGCIRFDTEVAKKIFDFLQTGDQIVVYKTFENIQVKQGLRAPIATDQFWIRQRFNSPLRSAWNHTGDLNNLQLDYDEHTGVDFAPNKDAADRNVYAIADGAVAKIQQNDGADHGMGAAVIVEHMLGRQRRYAVYAHLASIAPTLAEGMPVAQGTVLGTVGNSAYGCQTFWKVGTDGCESANPDDIHLHFEIKTKPVLENPEGGAVCKVKGTNELHACYGYTPGDPRDYGYLDPITTLFDKK